MSQVIEENKKIIENYTRHYISRNTNNYMCSYDDYYQEACLAALLAHKEYDPNKGPWENYLAVTINNSLRSLVNMFSVIINASHPTIRKARKVKKMAKDGLDKSEIISKLNISESVYHRYINLTSIDRTFMIDNLIAKSDIDKFEFLDDCRTFLSKDEYSILSEYLAGYNLTEISKRKKISYSELKSKFDSLTDKIKKYNES